MIDEGELEVFRDGLRHAVAAGSGEALDSALEVLGWGDALGVDRRAAVSVLFELLGRADASCSALDLVFADLLGVSPEVAVVLPPLGTSDPPGRRDGETVVIRGAGMASLPNRRQAMIVARSDAGEVALCVDTGALTLVPLEGIDPETGLSEVTARIGVHGAGHFEPEEWEYAVAVARLALSHQLVGASRAMLELACDHARDRVQFGRPIAGFQAVRHRLADSLVAIEAAEAGISSAWEDGSPLTATLAKAIAGQTARTVAGHCQQVLAGMGFTTEHPFHRYLRGTILLDQLLGDSRSLFREVGEDLLEARSLPALLPL